MERSDSLGISRALVLMKTMVYGLGQELAEDQPGMGTTFIQSDFVGSPSVMTDASGAVVGRSKALPFGERYDHWGQTTVRRYTNHEDDADSGAIYMQAREYLPAYGKFAQVDPAYDQTKDDPESWNLYNYVTNNPVTHTDPDGRIIDGELHPHWAPSGQELFFYLDYGPCGELAANMFEQRFEEAALASIHAQAVINAFTAHLAAQIPQVSKSTLSPSAQTGYRSWTDKDIAGYRSAVQGTIDKYKADGKRFTCEDLALSVLIDYSAANKLIVTIKNDQGSFTNSSYSSTDAYKRDVLGSTSAKHLFDTGYGNTVSKGGLTTAAPGDLAVTSAHIQLVTSTGNGMAYIAQGNYLHGDYTRFGYDSGLPKFGLGYPGVKVQSGVYNTVTGQFWGGYAGTGGTTGAVINSWNFTGW